MVSLSRASKTGQSCLGILGEARRRAFIRTGNVRDPYNLHFVINWHSEMLRHVACWGLNTGLSGANSSIFCPHKTFLSWSWGCHPSHLLLHTNISQALLPWIHFQFLNWLFLTRHIADVQFLKFPHKGKTEGKKTSKMMSWLKLSGTWKWILAVHSWSFSAFLWTPNFPESFPLIIMFIQIVPSGIFCLGWSTTQVLKMTL